MIITSPNEPVAPIHERMPVIPRQQDELAWPDAAEMVPPAVPPLLQYHPAGAMKAYPVSPIFSSVAYDGPEPVLAFGDLTAGVGWLTP